MFAQTFAIASILFGIESILFAPALVNNRLRAYLSPMPKDRTQDLTSTDSADLIVQLARLAQSGHGTTQLTPAQWTALRFFARANRFSRTPSAFSEFHATTRGTASQTVKSLVAMGFLERHCNENDGRSALFELTEAGSALLERDPLADLGAAIASLPEADRETLRTTLRATVERLARQRAAPVFGTCSDCSHCDRNDGTIYCHCTQSLMAEQEMMSLCVDFAPRPGSA